MLAQKGDLNGSIAECRAAILLQPNRAWSHALLVIAMAGKRDRRMVLEELSTAHRLDPANSFFAQSYEKLLRPSPPDRNLWFFGRYPDGVVRRARITGCPICTASPFQAKLKSVASSDRARTTLASMR